MDKTIKPIRKCGELAWLLGAVLCSLGVCLSAKSGFGVSMVVAPAFVLSNYLHDSLGLAFFTFGNTDYIVQGVFMLALIIVVGKFKIKYPLAFITAVIYGLMLDGWRLLFGQDIPAELYVRIIYMILAALIIAFSVALYLHTFVSQQVYDMFVYEVAAEKKKNVTVVKWIYDISSLVAAIVLMLILFNRFDLEMVGIGTLIYTVVNTPLIALFGKLLDKLCNFSPLFPKTAVKVFGYKPTEDNA